MSVDSSSFELVDSPFMVFPADMTSTPEKPGQPNTDQQPDPAEDPTFTTREPNIEDVKVSGRAEEQGKERLNSGEKPEEPGLDNMENRFRDGLQKKKIEGKNRDNGVWRLRAPGEGSRRELSFWALVLTAVWIQHWVLHRG